MKRLLSEVLVHLLSLIAVVQLYFSLPQNQREQGLWIFGFAAMCLILAAAIIWTIWEFISKPERSFLVFKERRIKKYMRNWLNAGGRSLIFTRDMTWANDQATKNALVDKAKRHELTICIEHQIPLSEELRQEGAQVICYGDLGVVPRSRYTIIDFQSDSARVAVGGAVGRTHVIQEFRNGEHPFFGVADDLARVLIAYSQHKNAPAN